MNARQYAFQLLFVYTASGLGLLLTTSFLGLRRYLRQRRQEMPLRMVNLWLGIGVALIAGIMFAAMLLPRPNAEYAISDLPIHVGSPDQHASRYGMGREGVEEQRPDARLEPRHDAKPDAPQSDKPGDGKSPAGRDGDRKATDNQQQPSNDQQKAEKHGESGNAKPPDAAKGPPDKDSAAKEKQPQRDQTDGEKGEPRNRNAGERAKPAEGSGTAEKRAEKPPEQREGSGRPSSSIPASAFRAADAVFSIALLCLPRC